jgi:hypothetical protein
MVRGPQTGQVRTANGPATSGQLPAAMTGTIPRPVVEVQPAGGRDFGWPHIAVLAAVAFTLGIIVWTVAGVGS